MSAVATGLRIVGYVWIAMAVALGVWQLISPIFEEGYGDVYLLLLFAIPGLAVVALANQVDQMKEHTSRSAPGRRAPVVGKKKGPA
jgi:hypothetical protein